MNNLDEKLSFKDFTFYHFPDDRYFNIELEYSGLKCEEIPFKEIKNKYCFDPLKIAKPFIQQLVEKSDDNFIIGFNYFKLDLFDTFKNSKEIYNFIREEWQHYAKSCLWNYFIIVRIKDCLYLIEEEIKTYIEYPEDKNNDYFFKLLVLPNKIKHFVHLNDYSEEEIKTLTPKSEVFRRLKNYFINNFHNCSCFFVNDL